MDAQLISFEHRTNRPEALERFLTEVLQLEIKESPHGLFRAQFGNVAMDVSQGEGHASIFRIVLTAESFADISARWEFFTFRYAERPEAVFRPAIVLFKGFDGETWQVTSVATSVPRENPEIHVRNC